MAQAEALVAGFLADEAAVALRDAGVSAGRTRQTGKHKAHPGNRPSSLLLMPQLTPAVLGQLVALYEHKVFSEAATYGINAFDQFGVELGKRLASFLIEIVSDERLTAINNPSTKNLLVYFLRLRDGEVK